MSIQLEAINFNFDTSAATSDAFNLRGDATRWSNAAEWQRGISSQPEDSIAAYAIAPTLNQTLEVEALFSCNDPAISAVEIRAMRVIPGAMPLGDIDITYVTFTTGSSGSVRMKLVSTDIWNHGVDTFVLQWQWQFRVDPGLPWTNFGWSQHRILVTLDVPNAPWQQTPYASTNTQLPWTDVLVKACAWARGALDTRDANREITKAIYALGGTYFEYDCPGGGATNYAYPNFDCTAFLDRLAGGPGRGRYVNCSDCATIVSTFANALGCDLWQSRMGYNFDLSPMLAIGSTVWKTACGWTSFSYHEVAWTDTCAATDYISDACLQVDTGLPVGPRVPVLPTHMLFGAIGGGQYRDYLATSAPTGRARCNPDPTTQQRRTVS